MSVDLVQVVRSAIRKGPTGVLLAMCRKPFTTSFVITIGSILLGALIYSGDKPLLSYLFRETNHFLTESNRFFWGTQVLSCLLLMVTLPLSYAAAVRPIVTTYLYKKSSEWRTRWKDVDFRVRHCLFSLSAIFLTWALMFLSYLFLDDWVLTVDLLVWINGMSFIYLWFSMRGRTVRHEHKDDIKYVLNSLAGKESLENEIYDLFTPWESRGEALLTNANVTPEEVVESLELERDALDSLAPRTSDDHPHYKSELATAEIHDTLVMLGLVLVMVIIPAVLFMLQVSIDSHGLETFTTFYLACIVAGTSIGLVATRLASIYLDVSPIVIALIVLYAACQPAFAFNALLEDHVEHKQTVEAEASEIRQGIDQIQRGLVAIEELDQADLSEDLERREATTEIAQGAQDIVSTTVRIEGSVSESVRSLENFQNHLSTGLFIYSLLGKLLVGFTFLKLLLSGRMHYYIYYLQRSHALLLVHRRLTTKSFPASRGSV